jgi:platelet-activating factor acetylhydrolase IB subunit alpha
LHASFNALRSETSQAEYEFDPKGKSAGLLEKKWSSVIRLQKKIMDLEARNAALLEELNSAPSTSRKSASLVDWVPRGSARSTLTGHRSPVTQVAFHPVFSVLATASEDASVKVWDWEGGELERTVKGHTKAVQDVDFDPKGNLMGASRSSAAARITRSPFRAETLRKADRDLSPPLAATCSSDLTVKLWDTSNEYKNTKTLYGHDHSVSAVRFLPSGDFLVSASRDRTIKVWEVATG